MIVRTGFTFYLHYSPDLSPLTDFTWTYPLRLAAWQVTLDYFFYCYHRYVHFILVALLVASALSCSDCP